MVQVTIRMKLNARNTALRSATVAHQAALKIVSSVLVRLLVSVEHSHCKWRSVLTVHMERQPNVYGGKTYKTSVVY